MGSKQPHPPIMGDQSGPSGSRLPSQLLQNPVKRGRPKNKTLEEMDNAAKKKRLSGALQQEPSASSLQHPPTKFNPNSIPETSLSNTVPPVEQGKEKKKSRGLFKRWRPKPEDACNTVLLHHGMPNYAKIKSFLCFLCKGYLIQPITYTECGHNFCGQCVSKAQKGKGGDKKQYCPQCGKEAPQDKDSVVSDLPLQQKVYKLAPRAYWIDLLRKRNECKTEAQEDTLFSDYIIEQSMKLVADDELVSIVFEYVSPPTPEELKALAGKEKVVRGTSPDPQLIEECDQPSTSKVVSEKKDEIVVEAEIVKKKQKEKKTTKTNIPTTFKRYFRTHARNTIGHLKKILDFKLWRPDGFQLVFYGQNVGDVLKEDMTIRDLVYHLGWKRYEPFRISFTLQKDILEEEAPPMLELEAMPELMAESDQNQAPPTLSTSEAPTSPLPSLTVSLASDLTNTSQPIITPGLMPSQLNQQRRKRKLSSPTKMRNSFDENNSNDSPTSTHNGGFDTRLPPSLPSSGDMSMMNRPPPPNQSPKHLPTLMTTVPPHLSMSTVPISHSSPMPLQPPSMMPPPLPPSSSAPSSLPILSHPGSSSRSPIVEQEKIEKSSSSRAPFVSTAQKYDIQVKPLPPPSQPSKPVVSQQAPLKVPQIPHPFNGAMQFFQQVMMPSPGVQNVNRKMNGGGNGRQMVPEQPGMRLVHVPMDIPAPMMAYLSAHQTFGRQIAQSMKKNPDEKSTNQLRLPTVPAQGSRPGGGDLEILNPVSMQQQLVSISQGSNLKQ